MWRVVGRAVGAIAGSAQGVGLRGSGQGGDGAGPSGTGAGDVTNTGVGATIVNDEVGGGAFVFEQLENLLRAVIAEELAERLLVPGDAVLLQPHDEQIGRAHV